MEIQRVSVKCNYDMPISVKNSVRNRSYISKSNLTDNFTPSFGLKPLTIPNGMFKTQKETDAFSKIVEEVRTGKISKSTAKKLVGKNTNNELFAKVLDFIKLNDKKVKLYDEDAFDNWYFYKIKEAKAALQGKKVSELLDEYENLATYFEQADDYNDLLYY